MNLAGMTEQAPQPLFRGPAEEPFTLAEQEQWPRNARETVCQVNPYAEHPWMLHAGAKETAIRDVFDCGATRTTSSPTADRPAKVADRGAAAGE